MEAAHQSFGKGVLGALTVRFVCRSLSEAQKEVIVNGLIEVPTEAGDTIINEVRRSATPATLRHSATPGTILPTFHLRRAPNLHY